MDKLVCSKCLEPSRVLFNQDQAEALTAAYEAGIAEGKRLHSCLTTPAVRELVAAAIKLLGDRMSLSDRKDIDVSMVKMSRLDRLRKALEAMGEK